MTSDGELTYKRLDQLTKKASTDTITLDAVSASPYATILQFFTTKDTAKFIKTELGQYDLKILDQIREMYPSLYVGGVSTTSGKDAG